MLDSAGTSIGSSVSSTVNRNREKQIADPKTTTATVLARR